MDIAQRTDTRGDAFEIILEKQRITDRGIAGELLNRIARRVAGGNSEYAVGSFAGLQIIARGAIIQETQLLLKGRNYYEFHIADSALGTVRSLEFTMQNLEDRLTSFQHDLANSEKRIRELEAKIGQPFEHEAKLQSLGKRQKELEEALDITKNFH